MFRILHLPSSALSRASFETKAHAETYLHLMEYYSYVIRDDGLLYFTFSKSNTLNVYEFSIVDV